MLCSKRYTLSTKKTPQTLIFYTLAECTVFLNFRQGFASTEEKSMLHHQHKYDAKTAFVSLGKAPWKSAWQKKSCQHIILVIVKGGFHRHKPKALE